MAFITIYAIKVPVWTRYCLIAVPVGTRYEAAVWMKYNFISNRNNSISQSKKLKIWQNYQKISCFIAFLKYKLLIRPPYITNHILYILIRIHCSLKPIYIDNFKLINLSWLRFMSAIKITSSYTNKNYHNFYFWFFQVTKPNASFKRHLKKINVTSNKKKRLWFENLKC